ncbi:ABC transporter permease [[Brevibacterium] flavum]|uniref:Transport permease protein n=1 Tax=[Brevibacterium] flavum TaxID=92706 RepID=A0A0F6SQL5_9CORY|nr:MULTISPECIES: ABC transporter permease [Corynebacterium]AKF26419.1 ABC transporter permease [[Brevibacterium] flavum]ANE07244.1 ABC transporter permease [Corynebacterium glutamicum]AST19653.1 ABC transporter permease [Corynebacterium glutamicum ATCC 14067]KEI22107.1 ABC transporter permease [Corynebacterium glutamicum ATCC 14067]KIH74736.1 ABC transporter permease [Corynebacterium glutamicum]
MAGESLSSDSAIAGSSNQEDLSAQRDGEDSNLVLVENGHLFSLQSRPSIKKYSKDLWDRRYFILTQARAKSLRVGQDTFLGRLWIILTPIISISIYAFIFGTVLHVSKGMDNFVGFLTLGVVYFGFFTKGISSGSGLIKSSKSMIAAFAFPKAALVMSIVLRQFIDNITPALIAIIGCVLLQLDQFPHWTMIFVVPLFFLSHVFILGTSFITARVTAFVPDLKSLISVINRGLFFVSGVFFTIDRFQTNETISKIVQANPIYQFLQAVRQCVMDGQIPSFQTWAYISVWSFGLVIIGYIFFWQAEARYSSVK